MHYFFHVKDNFYIKTNDKGEFLGFAPYKEKPNPITHDKDIIQFCISNIPLSGILKLCNA